MLTTSSSSSSMKHSIEHLLTALSNLVLQSHSNSSMYDRRRDEVCSITATQRQLLYCLHHTCRSVICNYHMTVSQIDLVPQNRRK